MTHRKTHAERMETARDAAWKQYGARNYRWIVGWEVFRSLLPVALVVVPVGAAALWLVRTIRGIGAGPDDVSAGSGQGAGLSVGWLPFILLAVSVLGLAGLSVWKWANPGRGGLGFGAAVVLFLALFASAVLWTIAAF